MDDVVLGERDSGAGHGHQLGESLAAAWVVSFDSVAWTATVRLAASESGLYVGTPVSRGLPAAALTPGARCLLWAPDAAPSSWLVVAVA